MHSSHTLDSAAGPRRRSVGHRRGSATAAAAPTGINDQSDTHPHKIYRQHFHSNTHTHSHAEEEEGRGEAAA